MANLITVLAVLFFSLFVVVYLLERFGPDIPNEKINKMSRFIFPLIGIFMILQAIRYFFF